MDANKRVRETLRKITVPQMTARERSTDHWYNNGGMTATYRAVLLIAMGLALTWLWDSKAAVVGIQTTLLAIEKRIDATDRRIDGIDERVRYVERRDR